MGVKLLLRWLLRTARHFHHRVAILVDAKAALCAVAKGRSGAAGFRPTLCSIGALLLASDTLLRPIYIPSEDNPADAPSRGKRRRPGARRVLKKPGYSKADRSLHRAMEGRRRAAVFLANYSGSDDDSADGCSSAKSLDSVWL